MFHLYGNTPFTPKKYADFLSSKQRFFIVYWPMTRDQNEAENKDGIRAFPTRKDQSQPLQGLTCIGSTVQKEQRLVLSTPRTGLAKRLIRFNAPSPESRPF
jgi:hypothetical protein